MAVLAHLWASISEKSGDLGHPKLSKAIKAASSTIGRGRTAAKRNCLFHRENRFGSAADHGSLALSIFRAGGLWSPFDRASDLR